MVTQKLVLAADLGGTWTRVALVDSAGKLSHRRAIPTLAGQGRDKVLQRLIALLREVATQAAPGSLAGLGLSLASPTDITTGVMHNPPNLPGWHGFSPKADLETALRLRTSLANDATLATLAEHTYGAGRGYQHLLYLTLSTGIGGGIITNGRLYTGSRGFAGELGHITIDQHGPGCKCGNVGCLEALASGTAVARMAQERLARGDTSVLQETAKGSRDELGAGAVFGAAAMGDRLAQDIVEEVAGYLGVGIVSLLHAFDPEIIILGGGMSRSLELLLPGITREIEAHAMIHQRGQVPLVRSELGDDAGLIGAALFAFKAGEGS